MKSVWIEYGLYGNAGNSASASLSFSSIIFFFLILLQFFFFFLGGLVLKIKRAPVDYLLKLDDPYLCVCLAPLFLKMFANFPRNKK